MRENIFEQIELPTPTLKKNCDSIYRKNIATVQKLRNIVMLAESSRKLNKHEEICLASECGDYLEKLYSTMNYASLILGEIFGSRGGAFKTNFHEVAVNVLKNKKGYQDLVLGKFIEGVIHWYPIVHDMRSEEAHFSMGKITFTEKGYVFCLNRESPRNSFYDTLKQLEKIPENRVVEYKLSIMQLKEILVSYNTTILHLENIVKTFCSNEHD